MFTTWPQLGIALTILLLIACVLFVYFEILFKQEKSKKLYIVLIAACLVAGILLAYGPLFRSTLQGETGFIRSWNVFHYYLGGKYYPEIGYTDLYSCILAADDTIWQQNDEVRDLQTYKLRAVGEYYSCPIERFGMGRWEEFVNDWQRIRSWEDSGYWKNALQDKGFNPSPIWTSVWGTLANVISLDNMVIFHGILLLDVIILFGGWIVLSRNFGIIPGLWIAFFTSFYFGTYGQVVGNFFQYTWLAAVWVGIGWWKENKITLSSAVLSYAVLERLFPAVLLIGFGLGLLNKLQDTQPVTIKKFFRHYFLSSLVLIAASSAVLGLESWVLFGRKILVHSSFIVQESFNMGLRNWLAQMNMTDSSRIVVFVLLILSVGIAYFFMVRRSSVIEMVSLSSVLLYFLLVFSPYYFLLCSLIFLLLANEDKKGNVLIAGSFVLLLFLAVVFEPTAYLSLNSIASNTIEVLVFLTCMFALGGMVLSYTRGVQST